MELPLVAIIDDEPELLENFEALLQQQYRVMSFTKPEMFLRQLPEFRADLKAVITDFRMPNMTGLEMIQKAYESGKPFPFVILSGQLNKQTVIEAVNQGVFRLLEKPIDMEFIEAVLDQLIMEQELTTVRAEIHDLTSKLRELYTTIRMALLQYIPEDSLNRMVVDAPNGKVVGKMSFEVLLEQLEERLEKLLVTETMILNLKEKSWKADS